MENVLIGLLGLAILLFILSFFQKDRIHSIGKEVDELSMNFLQENYQLKKRISVLEEELLMDNQLVTSKPLSTQTKKQPVHEIIKNQVISLYQQGAPIEQIARQSALTKKEVQQIIGGI